MKLKEKTLPEITVKAVVLGVLLSVILAGANAYLGLFAGMTVSASIPAAVISMGILRLFREHNILENNIVQTAASAGESLAAGVIFTLPALVIMNYWQDFNYLWVTVIAGFGGLLGVLFTIPLRRALIVSGSLKFPEGVATAEVLKTGEHTATKAKANIKHIINAGLAGGIFKLGQAGFGLWTEAAEIGRHVGSSVLYFGSNLSPALLSVGYIVGLNIATLIFLGGVFNWLIAIPICAAGQACPVVNGTQISAIDWASAIWSQQTRYIGVGAMVIGGLWAIFQMRGSIFQGITSGMDAYRNMRNGTTEVPRVEKDLPMKWVLILIIVSVVPLFLVYEHFVGKMSVTIPMAIVMLIAGFVFSAVAGYMAGLVGSSNNPISGVTIATVLLASLLLVLLMGRSDPNGPPAAIIIGAVICCAAAIAGDNMQDLKAGHIVKATPWKQQVMQMIGTLAAALVLAPILMVLYKAYGFAGHASAKTNALSAVQANLMATVAQGAFAGNLPWLYIIIGAFMAVVIIAIDLYLKKINSKFRMPVLAVAIGFYLPFKLGVPIFIGGLLNHLLTRRQKRLNWSPEKIKASQQRGLLFASGLITGEAILGILIAIPIAVFHKTKILTLIKNPIGSWPGIVLLAFIAWWLYRTAWKSKADTK